MIREYEKYGTGLKVAMGMDAAALTAVLEKLKGTVSGFCLCQT